MEVLEKLYNEAMDKPLQILEVFNEFFGESRVDMQGFPILADIQSMLPEDASVERIKERLDFAFEEACMFILVHFPHVRITNEHDRYVDANNLYAKVIIDTRGLIQGKFLLNRSEYTILHFENNYMHSHISHIPVEDFTEFLSPCTGSGPINSTICSLARDFDIDLWRLFCLELDKFMNVESLSGGPYHRLESLTEGGINRASIVRNYFYYRNYPSYLPAWCDLISKEKFLEFIEYIIYNNKFTFSYTNGEYKIGMSPIKFNIVISNLFIDWYNIQFKLGEVHAPLQELMINTYLYRAKFSNGQIVLPRINYHDYRDYIGAKICTFKGHDVVLTISDEVVNEDNNNDIILLNSSVVDYILTKICNLINSKYGNTKQEGDGIEKKVYFI